MQHLDEGIIHSWIDGELPADEASRVEAHAKSCAACGAMVAEARGFVAASSRIVSTLDVTPGGVLPAFGARKVPRRWMMAKWSTAIAATLVIAAGTVMTMRGRVETPASVANHDTAVVAPLAQPTLNPPIATPNTPTTTTGVAPRVVDRAASPMPVAQREGRVGGVAAPMTAPAAAAPALPATAPAALTAAIAKVAAGAPTGAGGAGGVAVTKTSTARSSMAGERRLASVADVASLPAYVGCYEVNESTDVLPKRFALRADSARSGAGGLYEVRYVDSTGAVDGRIVDVGWMETGGRAAIRTAGRGEILTFLRVGNVVMVQSPLGPRTVRVTSCRLP